MASGSELPPYNKSMEALAVHIAAGDVDLWMDYLYKNVARRLFILNKAQGQVPPLPGMHPAPPSKPVITPAIARPTSQEVNRVVAESVSNGGRIDAFTVVWDGSTWVAERSALIGKQVTVHNREGTITGVGAASIKISCPSPIQGEKDTVFFLKLPAAAARGWLRKQETN